MAIGCYNRSQQAEGAAAVEVPRLRLLRLRVFLTQEELSEKSGLSLTTIQRLEVGKSRAHLKTIRKLAEALGVKPEELIGQTQTGS